MMHSISMANGNSCESTFNVMNSIVVGNIGTVTHHTLMIDVDLFQINHRKTDVS